MTPAPSPSVDHPHAPPGASPASRASRGARWRATVPLASLLVLVAVMWGGAAVADSFPTDDVDSWGFVFGAFVLTFLYAPLPLFATLTTALIGGLSSRPSTVRAATVAGVIVAGLSGVAAVCTGVFGALDGAAGDRVFGLSLVAGGLVAVSTALLLRRS